MRCLSVANKTNNYKFPKPEADDFYDISEYNKAMDILDDSLTEMDQKKLDKNGDASEAVTEFEQEILRENIESGETLSSMFGKVKKWFSEMKDVAFSGHAKDVATDAAHRFVSDTEKSGWNGKVGASGGDISETNIDTLECIDSKYPIPVSGEKVKVFMGKVKKYIEDTKPLDADAVVYVDTTGSDTNGEGTIENPYKSITYALSKIPKKLGGFNATINVADGTYEEAIELSGYDNGHIVLRRNGLSELNSLCTVNSIKADYCDSVSIVAFNFINKEGTSVFIDRCKFVNVAYCQSILKTVLQEVSFNFDYTPVVRIFGCRSLNHNMCLRAYQSHVFSQNWSGDSVGNYGIFVDGGGRVSKAGALQPRGLISNENNPSGSVIVNTFGAKIGTLSAETTLYVATTGSDTTGNGTSSSPFKTIQRAVDILPKDLGGCFAYIIIANGTYDEDVIIYGYRGGVLFLKSNQENAINNDCKVKSISVKDSTYTQLYGITFTTTSTTQPAITAWNSVLRVAYCQSTVLRPNSSMIYVGETVCDFRGCRCINSQTIVASQNSRIVSLDWTEDSTAKYSFSLVQGSILSKSGTQPSGQIYNISSPIFNRNGTQISDLITSGLSCTWGIVRGGYYKHGNLNGSASVTVQLNIVNTSPLSAGRTYTIDGLPIAALGYDFGVGFNRPRLVEHVWYANDGRIAFVPIENIPINVIFLFNCTYITNS